MAKFEIKATTSVAELKKQFSDNFAGVLRVYAGRSEAPDDAALVSLGAKEGSMECRASRTVGKFIEEFMVKFNLKVKVYTVDNWVAVLDGVTLDSVKAIKKQAKKSDMEALIAYQRKQKEEDDTSEQEPEPTATKRLFNWESLIDKELVFFYKYQKGGSYVTVRADILYDEDEGNCYVALSDNPDEGDLSLPEHFTRLTVSLKDELLDGCRDFDECGAALAKLVVKEPDGEVEMSVFDTFGEVLSKGVHLSKVLDLLTDADRSLTLFLQARGGRPVEAFNISEFDDDELASKIEDLIQEEDSEGLFEVEGDLDTDWREVFNLWGDEDEETLLYEINDDKGNILENGTIPVRESNVFDYSERSIIAHNRPKYIFIHCDEVKKAYATFRVPASFNIRNCHFENAKFYNLKDIDWDKFGDSMTSICTVHFSGMEFDPEDFGDKGTWGSTNFILFKYDETRDSYDEVASME